SLANPLLIQVIIDKVINQRSLETLQVLGIALLVVTLMEGIIGGLRTFLFSEVTNRIDMRLASEVTDHLLRLPLGYFEKRPVGDLGTRIAELEKIRSFITGQSLSTLLDTCFSIIYITVMLFYSWLLTLLALSVLPIQVAITLMGAPLFRRQYRDATRENARAQSYMNELLTGIQTVKAQNVEMISRSKWQGIYGKYISRSFKNNVTGTVLSQISKVLQKLSQLVVLWVGATLVLKGQMSLGQLIAFRIISGYVTQPLLRLSGTWQKIQEIKVSLDRIADVVDTQEESDEADRQKIPMPSIVGDVKFEAINFAFNTSTREVLRNISIHIPVGTFVAVVGQSGSGKSTFTKLIPRLYSPNSGRVFIDDYDIDKVELYSLRRQIGIVPQDPLLFAGTVSENVALADSDASSEAIIKACRLACANDFIMQLPTGYSSQVGERGSSLSGGQRQRLAIARTLLERPKLLILDEATSALDYDTERRVYKNLIDHFRGTTMFIVTHRLSTIIGADMIIMLDDGVVVETGSHAQLMDKRGRYYALYSQQESGVL
ncbi:MAG: peptidase domain-containing ABC transporter, partial [Prochlorococcus sp.]